MSAATSPEQDHYMFVAYSWTSVQQGKMTAGTANAFLEVKTSSSLVSIRSLEATLRLQYGFQSCVVINYKNITKEEYLLEMKASQPISN